MKEYEHTAKSMTHNIIELLRTNGYTVDVVNDVHTVDSIVEHDVDLDVLGEHYMFNMNINVNRMCTREQYLDPDDPGNPRGQ